MKKQKMVFTLFIAALILMIASAAAASTYPDRPIRIIVSHAAGGATDIPIRVVAPQLQKYLGVPVVLENMEGAGGNIARTYVYNQPPDGYTFLVTMQPSFSAGSFMSTVDFDALNYTYVYNMFGKDYQNVTVHPDGPLVDLDAVIAEAQKRRLTMAVSGIGSMGHLGAVMMNRILGVDIRMVPYPTSMECARAVANGEVDMGQTNTSGALTLWTAGQVEVMAIHGATRVPSFPNSKTVAEQGYPELSFEYLLGVYGPPGIPQDILDILVDAFDKAMEDPDTIRAYTDASLIPMPLHPKEFEEEFVSLHRLVENFAQDLLDTSAGN